MVYTNKLKEILNQKQVISNKRGMELENDLNITNKYYLDIKKAFIYKKPTPIKIVKTTYPTKSNKKVDIVINEAYFESPSTTDYNGLYKGKYIDFEAKETTNKTSFPLENIHKHQINHLRNIMENDGIAFLIIRFIEHNKTYLLFAKDFFNYIDKNNKKSIPYNYFEEKAYEIKEKYSPRLDYLEIVDKYLKEYLEVKNGKEEK